MKKLQLTLCLAMLLTNVYTAKAENKVNSHNESVDTAGAKTVTDVESEASVDSSGTTKIVSDYKGTHDPKGLMNKTKEFSHTESQIKANGERKDTVSSVDTDGTAVDYTAEVKVDKHLGGAETTTIKSKEVVDPKGLLNKHSAEITKEVIKNSKGAVVSSTVTKAVNDKVVVDHK